MRRYRSLININPSNPDEKDGKTRFGKKSFPIECMQSLMSGNIQQQQQHMRIHYYFYHMNWFFFFCEKSFALSKSGIYVVVFGHRWR